MTTLPTSDIAIRRQRFFEYFRNRVDTLKRTDIPAPDRLVLSSAGLDALAKHWFVTAGARAAPANISGLERMRLFLLRHGNHEAFDKVSAPLVRQATGKEVGAFPFNSYKPNSMNEVRDWRSDPALDEIDEAALDRKTALRWSYAGILYVDLRCAWVHNFVQKNEDVVIHDADFLGRGEPYYRYVNNKDRFRLMLPLPFLTSTLDTAIMSFERETTVQDILPFVD